MLALALGFSANSGTLGTVPVACGAVCQEESPNDAIDAQADPGPAAVETTPTATAQEATEAKGLDKQIDEQFGKATGWFVAGIFAMIPISQDVEVPWVLFPLVIGAIFFTLYFGFPNLRYLGTSVDIIRGKYDDLEEGVSTESSQASLSSVDGDNPDTTPTESHDGEVSHFQALTAALSGTVGLGNIAGVAIALSLGGPGATFWMIVCGLLGMSSKFVECTLGVAYREINSNGTVYGGPMYYLSKGLQEKGLGVLGKILAVLFAVMCIGGSFGGGNMFQANQAFQLFATQTGIGEGYGWLFGLVLAMLVIVGVIVQGFKRAAFSNEAGIGSASIAHSAVKTKHPASEGLVALLEPFIDTVVVCTMTALVIVISNFDGSVMQYGTKVGDDAQAVVATSGAFEATISWFPWVLMVAVILFAFSTMISWSYYGYQAWSYLFGRSKVQEYVYKLAMLVPNMIGLFILAPKAKQELVKYMAAIKS